MELFRKPYVEPAAEEPRLSFSEKEERMKILKIGKSILTVFLLLILLVNIVTMVQIVVLGQEMPMLFGYGKAVVATGSMEPAISPGDMIIFRGQDDYEVGDIVIFEDENFVTHRIIERTENGFITKGDANNVDDGEILTEQMTGKIVLIIPKVGYAADFLKSPLGILVIVIGLLALIELPNLVRRKSKR